MDYSSTAQPLHPESLAFVEMLKKLNVKPYNQLETLELAREQSRKVGQTFRGDVIFDGTRSEIFIPSSDVQGGIPVYVYTPKSKSANCPILVYFHGGGSVVGCRENVETTCQTIARGGGCVVVSVKYRLAPEHKFPAGMDDGCLATHWVLQNRIPLGGGARSAVGVAGDSAGGQITASVTHDVPGVAFQVLIYPRCIAAGPTSIASYTEYKDGPILSSTLIDWFVGMSMDPVDYASPRGAAVLRPKFDHIPPTLFIVAECDPIRDDSYEYSKLLTAAGVPNELYLAKGAIHGFFTMPGHFVTLAKSAHDKTIQFIKTFNA